MGTGNLLQITSKGTEDIYLYGNPQITFFKNSYNNGRNFAVEYYKLPSSDSVATFGSTLFVEIQRKADLLGGLYLDIELSDLVRTANYHITNAITTTEAQFTSYVNGIGYQIIKEVSLQVNGITIQTFNGELIGLINQLANCESKQNKFNSMTNYSKNFVIGVDNKKSVKCHLPLPFYFGSNPGLYLPLCSLSNSKIEIKIVFKNLSECLIKSFATVNSSNPDIDGFGQTTGTPANGVQYNETLTTDSGKIVKAQITAQYIHLDDEEKKMFLNCSKLDYLIPNYHIGSTEIINNPTGGKAYYFDIDPKHPTDYILWLVQREDVFNINYYDNFSADFGLKHDDGSYPFDQKSHLLQNTDILINNETILEDVNTSLISNIQFYERFNGNPIRPLYVYNFSLDPMGYEPKGTFNLSSFRHRQLRVTLTDETNYTDGGVKTNLLLRYYTSYHNILVIENGQGGLVYQ